MTDQTKTGVCAECSVAISWRLAFCRRCYGRIPASEREARVAAVFKARRSSSKEAERATDPIYHGAVRCLVCEATREAEKDASYSAVLAASLSDAALASLTETIATIRREVGPPA